MGTSKRDRLHVGMSFDDVIAVLGQPDSSATNEDLVRGAKRLIGSPRPGRSWYTWRRPEGTYTLTIQDGVLANIQNAPPSDPSLDDQHQPQRIEKESQSPCYVDGRSHIELWVWCRSNIESFDRGTQIIINQEFEGRPVLLPIPSQKGKYSEAIQCPRCGKVITRKVDFKVTDRPERIRFFVASSALLFIIGSVVTTFFYVADERNHDLLNALLGGFLFPSLVWMMLSAIYVGHGRFREGLLAHMWDIPGTEGTKHHAVMQRIQGNWLYHKRNVTP